MHMITSIVDSNACCPALPLFRETCPSMSSLIEMHPAQTGSQASMEAFEAGSRETGERTDGPTSSHSFAEAWVTCFLWFYDNFRFGVSEFQWINIVWGH